MSEHKLFMYHIDLKRPQWTPSYLYNTVKLLKAWGFNSILYEMEDKFIFKNHPSLADIEAPPRISTANFVNICKSFGIEVIPMMQSLGHAECVARTRRRQAARTFPRSHSLGGRDWRGLRAVPTLGLASQS